MRELGWWEGFVINYFLGTMILNHVNLGGEH